MVQNTFILCSTILVEWTSTPETEQKRRYNKEIKDHNDIVFTPETEIPRPWHSYLECQQCKRSIVEALGLPTYVRQDINSQEASHAF